jgi:hypothetical protein
MTDYQKLQDWMDRNEKILANRTLEEKGDMARAVGFSPLVVAQWQTSSRFKEYWAKEAI